MILNNHPPVLTAFPPQSVLCTIWSESYPSFTPLALTPICSLRSTLLWKPWSSTWVNTQSANKYKNLSESFGLLMTSFLLICPPASKVDASKHGMMKFREERSILGLGRTSGSFHERYFILNSNSLRMYKEVRVRLTRSANSFTFSASGVVDLLTLSPSLSPTDRVTAQNVTGLWRTSRFTWASRRKSVLPLGECCTCSAGSMFPVHTEKIKHCLIDNDL